MDKTVQLNWEKSAPGIYRAVICEGKTLLDYSDNQPRFEALNSLPDCSFPFDKEIDAYTADGRTVVCVPLSDDEDIYGLGLNFKSINQRGKALTLKTDHYTGSDTGRTHAPCPVYFTNKNYGVLFNTASYINIYCSTAVRKGEKSESGARDRNTDKSWTSSPKADYVEMSAYVRDGFEIIVFAAGSLLETVSKYNLYCGGGHIPPKWGLGFWYRFASKKSQNEVISEYNEFLENNIHVDVVGFEPGWQSKAYPCTFEWSKERFPDPQSLCETLLKQDTRVNLWENPYISPDSKIYHDIYPLSGSHTVWCGIVPDYTIEEAREMYKNLHRTEHLGIGVSGYKLDECDGYDKWLWPDHAQFPSGVSAESYRQTFGLSLQKLTSEIFEENNMRTYGLVRASNSGGGKYPYVIYNDKYDFEEYLMGLCTSAFNGISWVPEVRKGANPLDWLRRFQLSAFSPMLLLNSWASGAKPWTYPEVSKQINAVINMRRVLMPYLYNAYASYYFDGVPVFRPLVLDYPKIKKEDLSAAVLDDTDNPYMVKKLCEINDQIFIGKNLMAVFPRLDDSIKNIIIPNGVWYDYYTGETIKGPAAVVIKLSSEDNRIPLYVKEGGIIPLLAKEGETLDIRCYGSAGECILYDDDGVSTVYKSGAYNTILLKFTFGSDGFNTSAEYIKSGSENNYKAFNFMHIHQ